MAAAAAAFAACLAARAVADQGAAQQSMPGVAWWSVAGWGTAGAAAAFALARVPWFRPSAHVGPASTVRAEAGLVAFAASFLLGALGGWIAMAAFAGDAPPDAAPTLRSMALQGLGARAGQLAAVAAALALAGSRVPSVMRGGAHPRPCGTAEALLLAAAWAILLWPVAQGSGALAGAAETLSGAARPALGHATLEALSASGTSDPWWWVTVASAVALAPVAEELVYRCALQRALASSGLGDRAAIATTSAIFAAAHLPVLPEGARWSGLATLFALSVGWGLLYRRTGRLLAPILAHAAFNAANLAIASAA
jgi:membrane protease YdiL (CAAX protease family)